MYYVTSVCTSIRNYFFPIVGEAEKNVLMIQQPSYLDYLYQIFSVSTIKFNNYVEDRIKHRYRTINEFLILCDICMDEDKNTALIPCGHVFCKKCIVQVDTCPICRTNIIGQLKIYL